MLISGNNNLSKLRSDIAAARHFKLSVDEAKAIFDRQREAIESNWDRVCDEASLSEIDRNLFWKRQFLNPSVFE